MKQEDENACITWLDKKSKHSVVYISFGSLWNPPVELIKSIAEGLKASKQPYLWALRPSNLWPSSNVYELLPEHFSEETDGLIIPWAPQLDVLAHSSVGAFLTHCGWNSTLESMCMGVPMIPIPIKVDQTTNCRLIIDIWKVGVNVKFVLRSDGPVVSSDDVERAVNLFFHDDEGSEMSTNQLAEEKVARSSMGILSVLPEGSKAVKIYRTVERAWDSNTDFLQDCAIRFLCIFSLDRYGLFIVFCNSFVVIWISVAFLLYSAFPL